MKYLKLAGVLTLVAAFAFGCSDEQPTQAPLHTSSPSLAIAPNTEALGPIDINLLEANGIVAAGVGLRGDPATQLPGTIEIDVPGKPVQAILFWEGLMEEEVMGDNEILVNINGTGPQVVTGTFIGGGPTSLDPDGNQWSTAFRAEITGTEWNTGMNTIEISEMNFTSECPGDCRNDGAGVVVLYDEGSDYPGFVGIREGDDVAFRDFPAPRDATVPQTFNFPMDDEARDAMLYLMAGSVSYPERPNVIYVSIDGGPAQAYADLMGTATSISWDTVGLPLTVPAGATEVTVWIASEQADDSVWPDGSLPASLVWVSASLFVEAADQEEPPGDCESCTPGYWKNHAGSWDDTPYEPTDDFDDTFGVDYFDPDLTLCEALWNGGGGVNALGRHAVAALLNASHDTLNSCLTADDIFDAVENMDKKTLADYNEDYYCPLGGPSENGKCWEDGDNNNGNGKGGGRGPR